MTTTTCTGCAVQQGTHQPAEALHQQIDEPQAEAMRLADECEESATHWVHEIDTRFKAAKMLRAQHARIAELESQLEAIGAGGVEPLRKTAAQGIEKDAARYRWLRNRMLGVDFDWCENGITALAFEMPDGCAYGSDCDQNIDAAIAAKAKE